MCPSALNRAATACVEPLAVGRRQDHRARRARARPRIASDRREQRLRLQHHPRPAAERHVVHDPVPVGREVPQVVHRERPAARARSPGRRSPPPAAPRTIAGKIVTMSIFTASGQLRPARSSARSAPPADRPRCAAPPGRRSTQMSVRPAESGPRRAAASTTSRLRSIGPSTARHLADQRVRRCRCTSQPTRSCR